MAYLSINHIYLKAFIFPSVCYTNIMKKIIFSSIILGAALILSGCSLAPTTSKIATPVANPNNSIWASFDSGKVWTNNFLPNGKTDIAGVDVLSMAVNPYDAKNVFVGTKVNGIFKTDNGGDNWEALNFQSEKVYGLDIDPADGRIIYASGVWQKRGKIFKSSDSGAKWEEIYSTVSVGPLVISLVTDKRNSGTVYVTTSDNQVLKTTDGGTTWKNIYTSQMPVLNMAIDSANSNLIYGVTQDGDILRSKDGGKVFENLSSQISAIVKTNLEFSLVESDPSNANWAYAAGKDGMFISKDAGNNWTKIEVLNNTQTFPIKTIAINPKNSQEIIYGAAQATFRSIDSGNSWQTFQFDISPSVKVIKYATADPTNLYLGFSK